MFRQYKCYTIRDGAKLMAINDDQLVFWTDDPRKAHLFSSHQEAEIYRRNNFQEEIHRYPTVKPLIILYIEP